MTAEQFVGYLIIGAWWGFTGWCFLSISFIEWLAVMFLWPLALLLAVIVGSIKFFYRLMESL